MKILGIAGSLRRGSYNRALLRAATASLPGPHNLSVFRGLAALPPYSEDADVAVAPLAVQALRRAISSSGCLIIATPEYNGSVPGVLKNAIDWASRPFPENCLRGKPVLVIGASSGFFGAVWAQADLRRILKMAGADALDHQMAPVRAEEVFDTRGRVFNPTTLADVGQGVRALINYASSASSNAAMGEVERARPSSA